MLTADPRPSASVLPRTRYENWDSQLTQRTSADSPRWVAFRAQDSPDNLRPESNGGCPGPDMCQGQTPAAPGLRTGQSTDSMRHHGHPLVRAGLGGLDAPPLTPSILRLTNNSRGSCGPMWSSQARLLSPTHPSFHTVSRPPPLTALSSLCAGARRAALHRRRRPPGDVVIYSGDGRLAGGDRDALRLMDVLQKPIQ